MGFLGFTALALLLAFNFLMADMTLRMRTDLQIVRRTVADLRKHLLPRKIQAASDAADGGDAADAADGGDGGFGRGGNNKESNLEPPAKAQKKQGG